MFVFLIFAIASVVSNNAFSEDFEYTSLLKKPVGYSVFETNDQIESTCTKINAAKNQCLAGRIEWKHRGEVIGSVELTEESFTKITDYQYDSNKPAHRSPFRHFYERDESLSAVFENYFVNKDSDENKRRVQGHSARFNTLLYQGPILSHWSFHVHSHDEIREFLFRDGMVEVPYSAFKHFIETLRSSPGWNEVKDGSHLIKEITYSASPEHIRIEGSGIQDSDRLLLLACPKYDESTGQCANFRFLLEDLKTHTRRYLGDSFTSGSDSKPTFKNLLESRLTHILNAGDFSTLFAYALGNPSLVIAPFKFKWLDNVPSGLDRSWSHFVSRTKENWQFRAAKVSADQMDSILQILERPISGKITSQDNCPAGKHPLKVDVDYEFFFLFGGTIDFLKTFGVEPVLSEKDGLSLDWYGGNYYFKSVMGGSTGRYRKMVVAPIMNLAAEVAKSGGCISDRLASIEEKEPIKLSLHWSSPKEGVCLYLEVERALKPGKPDKRLTKNCQRHWSTKDLQDLTAGVAHKYEDFLERQYRKAQR